MGSGALVSFHAAGDASWREVEAVLSVAVRADVLLIEGLSFVSKGSATRDLAGLWWLMVDELRALDVPLAVVAPGALKKWATGRGTAPKRRVNLPSGVWS